MEYVEVLAGSSLRTASVSKAVDSTACGRLPLSFQAATCDVAFSIRVACFQVVVVYHVDGLSAHVGLLAMRRRKELRSDLDQFGLIAPWCYDHLWHDVGSDKYREQT